MSSTAVLAAPSASDLDLDLDPDPDDDELTALALAADVDAADQAALGDGAVPWRAEGLGETVLPSWYMPAPLAVRRDWKTRTVAGAFVLALLLLNAAGLCVTYGRLVLA